MEQPPSGPPPEEPPEQTPSDQSPSEQAPSEQAPPEQAPEQPAAQPPSHWEPPPAAVPEPPAAPPPPPPAAPAPPYYQPSAAGLPPPPAGEVPPAPPPSSPPPPPTGMAVPPTPPPYSGYQQPAYQAQGYTAVANPPTESQATVALILGILSICCVGIILGPIAYFVGTGALNRINASGGTLGGAGIAQAGRVLGIIGAVLSFLGIIAWIAIAIGSHGSTG